MPARRFLLVFALLTACAPAATSASPSPSRAASATPAATAATTATGSEIDRIKAKGTVVVAIRVEAPPLNRAMGDPAHAQKRAFETAVATLVANAVFGPSVKVQLQSQGGDRLTGLDQGADLAMVSEASTSRDRALISAPYAANSVVVAVKDGGPVLKIEDLTGKNVGFGQDELVTRDLAQMFFQQKTVAVTLDMYMGVSGAATALEADRSVAFVGDGMGVAFVAAERKLRVLTTVTPRPYVIAAAKSSTELAKAVNAALADALKSGAIKDAAAKAGLPYTAP